MAVLFAGYFRVYLSRTAAIRSIAGAVNKKALLLTGWAFIRWIVCFNGIVTL
jgi:hypothetical protein